MPHPLVNRTDIKVQTGSSMNTPVDCLATAVEDLKGECDFLADAFKDSIKKWRDENPDQED